MIFHDLFIFQSGFKWMMLMMMMMMMKFFFPIQGFFLGEFFSLSLQHIKKNNCGVLFFVFFPFDPMKVTTGREPVRRGEWKMLWLQQTDRNPEQTSWILA